ncbi:MAG TPA: glycosyltransferase [Saprospiraceae bacterium]|nr:glycosyltransferase [Saprospiraceae bacterium]HMQ85378.1 glycosyltransferase [Saprospiraceae bacterium]
MNKPQRILIVTATWKPAQNPNVYRWATIAEQWRSMGHEVHVLCTRRKGQALHSEVDGVSVHRAGFNSLLDWLYDLTGKEKRRGEAGGMGDTSAGHLWRRMLEKIVDYTWRCFYWPDGRCLWYWPGRRRLKTLHQQHGFDRIYSVGIPFTAHLIALSGKKKEAALLWHMDIEDPFSVSNEGFINNRFLYAGLNRRAEAKALRMADSVSVTVEAARKKYALQFPESADKFSVIPPLFNLKWPDITPAKKHTEAVIQLAYFGAFYHHIRTPDAFLDLLDKLLAKYPTLPIAVHFYGEIGHPFAATFAQYTALKPYLHFHGLVSLEAVAQAMQEVDILVNISNKTTYHLPSKCVDYLMCRKPIINICYQEADAFKAFFQDYPLILHLVFPEDKASEEQIEAIAAFIKSSKGQLVDEILVRQQIEPHLPQAIASAYLSNSTFTIDKP